MTETPSANHTGSTPDEYVELHAASAFSFLDGASQPDALVERAGELDMPAMALADRNGVYGVARFHTTAKRIGVKAHIGAEIAVSSFGSRLTAASMAAAQSTRRAASHRSSVRVADRDIRICASSSRDSRCAKPPRLKARRRSKTWKNFRQA